MNEKIILDFCCGQPVSIRNEGISATVVSIWIKPDGVMYQCAWFQEGKRVLDYLYPFELTALEKAERPTVGWRNGT